MSKLFDMPQSAEMIRFISHRGFQPMAPANSLSSFQYAGILKQWAIETDVRFTKDGMAVCCHDPEIDTQFEGSGTISEMCWSQLSKVKLKHGNRLCCLAEDKKRMPLFSEYLAICRKYGSIPFIELKTPDTEKVLAEVQKAGFTEEEVIMSSSRLDWLTEIRKAAPNMFVHLIFGTKDRIDELASLGNAGMSWKIDDPLAKPTELISLSHNAGIKVCLRAADSIESLCTMISLGLDYIPTNCMHNPL